MFDSDLSFTVMKGAPMSVPLASAEAVSNFKKYTDLHKQIPKYQNVKITALMTKYGVTFYGRYTSTKYLLQ